MACLIHENMFFCQLTTCNFEEQKITIIISIHECANKYTVDSRYLEFDGTMEKIRVNRTSTQEELRRYRKCGLFNNERETARAKF